MTHPCSGTLSISALFGWLGPRLRVSPTSAPSLHQHSRFTQLDHALQRAGSLFSHYVFLTRCLLSRVAVGDFVDRLLRGGAPVGALGRLALRLNNNPAPVNSTSLQQSSLIICLARPQHGFTDAPLSGLSGSPARGVTGLAGRRSRRSAGPRRRSILRSITKTDNSHSQRHLLPPSQHSQKVTTYQQPLV